MASVIAGTKRKAGPAPEALAQLETNGSSPIKRARVAPDFSDRSLYKDSALEEEHGIILRRYYPPELTNERAKQYATGSLERPIDALAKALSGTKSERQKVSAGDAVIFWFKMDVRTFDNRGLSQAAALAKSKGIPLICVYYCSPQDWEAHLTSAVRVDFTLRCLKILQADLAELDIPLWVEEVPNRREVPARLLDLADKYGAKHIFCNVEYEVDELRREASLVRQALERGIAFDAIHDTCVVDPGELKTGAGGQISVYSPWHRKWCAYLNAHPESLDACPAPEGNPSGTRERLSALFDCDIPSAPQTKSLTAEEKQKFESMWPPGEHEAMDRLQKFIKERISRYHDTRNLPGGDGTSTLSAHLAAGTIAARTCVREALESAPGKKREISDSRKQGHSMWYGEVAWRDFYKHVLCNWPYICMSKPFKPEYSNIEWEYDTEQFKAWTEGRTGFPIVDAAMRQAKESGYMHNRCRMIVASFLAKDLLIDWRMGERWFMENLIDGDFASNNGGWGFSASCGVDPQPYFRIFNPLLQSEKFDTDGSYIRKWVPELKDVKGNAIHDPYGRKAEAIAKKAGYPKPMVVHKDAREKCLTRYKEGIGRSTA
ncbi:Deoxyribodipyrimidine photo-lyase [Cyphellophora attinorum]|uniref:Deoxyribodipyrimidine photo-lyase n=1 Tax=Cyphellophora attinorum TaxID=1664694 RepID=A0A0N1H2U2_9EURO|nr:Deoxyribodipyrimidine photo-lyase [Phialophora attinorum]KPI34517.1 Deoxyribodipyrimidine photo-lyase [Phialophora attinorum]